MTKHRSEAPWVIGWHGTEKGRGPWWGRQQKMVSYGTSSYLSRGKDRIYLPIPRDLTHKPRQFERQSIPICSLVSCLALQIPQTQHIQSTKVIQQHPFLSQTINSSDTGSWVFHIRVLSTPGLAQSPCLKILIKWIPLFYKLFFYNKWMPYFYLKSFFGFYFCNLTRPDLRT